MKNLHALIGKSGVAKSSLLACGIIAVGNELYEAKTRFEPIIKGDRVLIVDVHLNLLIVQKTKLYKA
ncbi:MAG: hypothetical protein AAF587_24535 [Bacteroidota bacterium]